MTEVSVLMCDECGKEIEGVANTYVDAGPYGIHLHKECFNKLTSLQIVQILGLDDIKIMFKGRWDSSQKITSLKGAKVLM